MADRYECQTCHVLFSSATALNTHCLTCVVKPITLSYYSVWRGADSRVSSTDEGNKGMNETDKILPPSQPLNSHSQQSASSSQEELEHAQNTSNPNYVCEICQKTLSTSNGLKLHRTACLKKQNKEQYRIDSQIEVEQHSQ